MLDSIYHTKHPIYFYLPFNVQRIPQKYRIKAFNILIKTKDPSCFQINNNLNLNIPWPNNKKYAFVLSHDIDSDWLYQNSNIKLFLDIEKSFDVKGVWFFVANLYKHNDSVLRFLKDEGHEIGLHGHIHDHKLAFLSRKKIKKRLTKCLWFIEKYQIQGFRSPSFYRTENLFMELREFVKYDSSVHISNINFPFSVKTATKPLLEFPPNILTDMYLYDSLKGPKSIIEPQLDQIASIKEKGGLATLTIHTEPYITGQKNFLIAFKEVINSVVSDKECWITTPTNIYDFLIKNLECLKEFE